MPDVQVTKQVRSVWRALRREVAARGSALDLTPPQLQVLWRLWLENGVLTSRLVENSEISSGTITGLLDRLEARGLVRRERCTDDRRVVRVYLTEEGRALQEPIQQAVAEVNAAALAGFTKTECEQLMELLQRMGENLGAE
jgi:MarR family transcriptional regulator, organic hydroperoxide resistance regulator